MTDINSFTLRSQSRQTTSASSSDCTITLANPVNVSNGRFYSLQYAQFYNSPYNITTGVNDTVDFKDSDAATKSFVIPQGAYNSSTLVSAIQTAINAAAAQVYTVSYDSTTRLIKFSAAGAFQLLFSSGSHAAISPWRELGFTNSTGSAGADTASATSATSTSQVNLAMLNSFYVQCPDLGYGGVDSNGVMYSFMLPDSAGEGNIQEYYRKNSFDQKIKISHNRGEILNSVRVRILNAFTGAVVNLGNSDWVLHVAIED